MSESEVPEAFDKKYSDGDSDNDETINQKKRKTQNFFWNSSGPGQKQKRKNSKMYTMF